MSAVSISDFGKYGFRYFDANENGQFDLGEVGFTTQKDGIRQHYTLIKIQKDNYYLAKHDQSMVDGSVPDPFFGKANFVYQERAGFVFAFSKGPWHGVVNSLLDPSDSTSYGMMALVPNSSNVRYPFPKIISVPSTHPSTADLLRSFLDDPNYLATLGFANIEDLYNAYHVKTEGEYFFEAQSDVEMENLGTMMSGVGALTFREPNTGVAHIILDDYFLSTIFDQGYPTPELIAELKATFLHEVVHAQESAADVDFSHPENISNKNMKIFYQKMSESSFAAKQELDLIKDENQVFTKRWNGLQIDNPQVPHTILASIAFMQCAVECKAYAMQLAYMDEMGLDNFSSVYFNKTLDNAVNYIDASLSLARFPEGAQHLREILDPILQNGDLKQALLDKAQEKDQTRGKNHFATRLENYFSASI